MLHCVLEIPSSLHTGELSNTVISSSLFKIQIIHLKHTLELVQPLREAIKGSESQLLVAYNAVGSALHVHKSRMMACNTVQTLEDGRFQAMLEKVCSILHDDTHYEKGALNMRTQRCFAIRSGMNGMEILFPHIFI